MKHESHISRKALVPAAAIGAVLLLTGAEGCDTARPQNPSAPTAKQPAKPKGGQLVTGCAGYTLEDIGASLRLKATARTASGQPPAKSDVNLLVDMKKKGWVDPDINVRGLLGSPQTQNRRDILSVKLENKDGRTFPCGFLRWVGKVPQALGTSDTTPLVETIAQPLPASQPTPTDMPVFYATVAEQVSGPAPAPQQAVA